MNENIRKAIAKYIGDVERYNIIGLIVKHENFANGYISGYSPTKQCVTITFPECIKVSIKLFILLRDHLIWKVDDKDLVRRFSHFIKQSSIKTSLFRTTPPKYVDPSVATKIREDVKKRNKKSNAVKKAKPSRVHPRARSLFDR